MYIHLHKKINDLVDFRRSSENPEENHSEYWAESVKEDVNSDIEEEKELGVENAPRRVFRFLYIIFHVDAVHPISICLHFDTRT